jgi:hypothetical protein
LEKASGIVRNPTGIITPETGYYSVDGSFFATRYEAMDAALRVSKPINYHHHDEIWQAQDWKTEPAISLPELYRKRAQQLRDKYDYLILSYSGGADSWNVLKTFDENNIHLDEIVNVHDMGIISGDPKAKHNSEVHRVAIPVGDQFLARHPKTIRTIIDSKSTIINFFGQHSMEELIGTHLQVNLSPSIPVRSGAWIYQDPRYEAIAASGKKIAIIYGWEKPYLLLRDGKYCFQFNDISLQHTHKRFNQRFPVYDEDFYWAKEVPELVVKQCHVVKRRLDSLPSWYIDPHRLRPTTLKMFCLFTKSLCQVSFITLNTWIYGWDPNTYTEGVFCGNGFILAQDTWIKNFQHEETFRKWKSLVKYINTTYYSKITDAHRNEFNPNFGPRAEGPRTELLSQRYWIE